MSWLGDERNERRDELVAQTITQLRRENDALRGALRGIVMWQYGNVCGCNLCHNKWSWIVNEDHIDGCLAAPSNSL